MAVNLASRLVPGLTERILTARSRRHNERVQKRIGMYSLYDQVLAAFGSSVLAGPFRGMRFTGRAAGSLAVPKLIGS